MSAVSDLSFTFVQWARNIVTLCAFAAFCASNLYGVGASLDIKGKTTEEAVAVTKKALERLDTTCLEKDITLGAEWRCKTPFFSIVGLDVFIATVPDKVILRADASNRQSFAFVDLVEHEIDPTKKNPNTYTEKSLWLTAGATLISPALGHWYVNENSMLKNRSTFLTTLGLFAGDLALFWMSSKIYFTHGFDPFDAGLTSMLITMGAYRAVMLVPFSVQVMAHNRFVGLQISFRF